MENVEGQKEKSPERRNEETNKKDGHLFDSRVDAGRRGMTMWRLLT